MYIVPRNQRKEDIMNLKPIGIIHSCYKEKFGIPRQAGIIPSATAILELLPPYNITEALRGLEEFSHLWIIFQFHQAERNKWKATVRPPRLGGNRRIGVFASRSPFRPNPIGLSAVELKSIKGTQLTLMGGDFLDGTPVFDIKPYIPYADLIPNAKGAFASEAPLPVNTVIFSRKIEKAFKSLENKTRPALQQLICDMLVHDPRPAYQQDDPDRIYGTRIYDLEIHWKQSDKQVTILEINKAKDA